MSEPTINIQNAPHASQDHDLLIRIDEKVERAISDIQELKNNFATRVSVLENEKVGVPQFQELELIVKDDHEKRLRKLERWAWIAIGALAIVEFAIAIYANFHN